MELEIRALAILLAACIRRVYWFIGLTAHPPLILVKQAGHEKEVD